MQLEVIQHDSKGIPKAVPLLFVHGAWHGAWCWDEHFLGYFAEQGYQSIALSLRGHGSSDGGWRWAGASGYVDDVAQVAQQFDHPPILIGHSMGGYVVQKYLEKYPASGAVLMASIPTSGSLLFILKLTLKRPLAMLRYLLTLNGHFWYTPQQVRDAFFSETIPDDVLQRYFNNLQGESIRIAFETMGLNLPKPKRIPKDIPMLVVSATRDAVFTVKEQEKTAKAYGTEAQFFDMAHDMMLEPNWKEVADAILTWIGSQVTSEKL